MAEVGLLPFARVALEVATAVLPRCRSRFSKHQFSQLQLLAVLCLMCYEDWTSEKLKYSCGSTANCAACYGFGAFPITRPCTVS